MVPKLRSSVRKLVADSQLPNAIRALTTDVIDPAQKSALAIKARNLSTHMLPWVSNHEDLVRAPSGMEGKSFTLPVNLLTGVRCAGGRSRS